MVGPEGITVEQWHLMPESHEAADGPQLELLDGEAVEYPAVTDEHRQAISRLAGLLRAEIGDKAVVAVQRPILLDDRSEPRPDLAVLSPRQDGYASKPPTAEDILLVIEVSDSWQALTYDRGRKAAYYSRCKISECWVLDLTADQILLLRSPASGGYRDQRNIRRGASPLEPVNLPGVFLPVEEILS